MTVLSPKIGIIGTGAIGGFYGMMLSRAGYDVHFLLRSEYDAVVEHGLRLNSAVHGTQHLEKVQAYEDAAKMPRCDWLLLGAKSTSNAALAEVITEAAAEGARVLVLQNGLGVEEQLRARLPSSLHLLGGLCFIYAHRSALGVVEHQALGGVNVGYHSGPAQSEEEGLALARQAADMFKAAGLDSTALEDLTQARWQKLVWNLPYNGLSVLLDAGTQGLMGDPDSREMVRTLMIETVEAARACGSPLREGLVDKLMRSTEGMPDYLPSMYHDHALGRPMELQAIYEAPLAAATAAGCDMPATRMLFQALRFLARRGD